MRHLLIALSLLFLVGCRKEKSFKVKVYNPVTEKPYEGVTVYVTERTNKSDAYGSITNTFFEGVTNSDGEVIVIGRFHKDYNYLVSTSNPNPSITFCDVSSRHNNRSSSVSLTLGNNDLEGSTAYFEYVPCAELKLKISNVNCQGVDDEMRFKKNNLDAVDDFNGWSSYRTGCYSYESPNYFDVAMGNIEYEWEVTRNGITNVFRDTFYLSEGEQRIYEINY